MRITITGKNMDLTNGLKNQVTKKLSKLEKYFADDAEARVVLSKSKGKEKIEVTIPTKSGFIRAEDATDDFYASIDLVEESIERQIKKYKSKLVDRKQSAVPFSDLFIEEKAEGDEEIRIVKNKKFEIKPMDPEEACLQMELLGHNFFVFLNSQTEAVNVVYRRNDKSYGLIEPEERIELFRRRGGCPVLQHAQCRVYGKRRHQTSVLPVTSRKQFQRELSERVAHRVIHGFPFHRRCRGTRQLFRRIRCRVLRCGFRSRRTRCLRTGRRHGVRLQNGIISVAPASDRRRDQYQREYRGQKSSSE